MKRTFCLLISLLALILFNSCETGEDTVVGSNQDTQIQNLSFHIDTTYLDSSQGRLIAKGTVINNGNSQVTSPWYVEGQFYTDRTYKIKLGGSSNQIGVPLSKGQSTFWTIYFSSSNVDVNDYPDARIADLRGIYK
jgi:hypothetical protein